MAPLFTIETSRARLTWSGAGASAPASEPLAVRVGEAKWTRPLALEEETSYPVLLQSLDGSAVSLAHHDPVVTDGLVSVDGGRVVHGRVRFGSQAGRARFVLLADEHEQAAFSVSVLPTKLSEADVWAMRADIEATAAGLSVVAIRPTTVSASGGPAPPSMPVWLAALWSGLDTLAEAVAEIARRPEQTLVRPVTEVPTGRVRRASAETRRAAERWGLGAAVLPARPARPTTDTPAHRWLAARLAEVERKLIALARAEAARRQSLRRGVLVGEVEALAASVARLRRTPVLVGATGRPPAAPPLVLRRRPAYAAAFDALRQLDRGLDLRGGALDVAMQDLAVVYETWCALAVVRAVAEALGVEAPAQPFGIETRGADVRLRSGWTHAVRFERVGSGGSGSIRVEIAYTPRFPAPPALLAQRPDLVLTVTRGGRTRRVVLDAKYRRDDSAGYRRRHGAAGPPEDALGTLHRYRDAIPGRVDLAAALFPGTDKPGTDDAFRQSRLWTSLETLGVGAVPLRPGHTAALADVIGRIVSGGLVSGEPRCFAR